MKQGDDGRMRDYATIGMSAPRIILTLARLLQGRFTVCRRIRQSAAVSSRRESMGRDRQRVKRQETDSQRVA